MRWVTVGAVAVLLARPHEARADAQECSTAAESGQTLRASGKWLDAREKFLACSATTCPSVVRTDCAKWASEILDSIPSIVVDARDAAGKDLTDVTVTIDGKTITTKLDGRGIPLDPGAHKLHFEHAGHPAVDDEIVAREKEKGRRVAVTFASGAKVEPAPEPTTVHEHTIYPWIPVGIGGALIVTGVVFFVIRPALPADCVDTSSGRSCTNPSSLDTAARHTNYPVYGGVLVGAGALLAVGGLVWHFLEPTGPEKRTARVVPTPGGLAVIGSF